MSRTSVSAFRWLTGLYMTLLIGIVILANRATPLWVFDAVRWLPFGDKAGHLVLMGILSFCVNTALQCRTRVVAGQAMLIGSAVVATLVLVEECAQLWIPSRNFERLDLLFDLLGIWLFGRLAAWNKQSRSARSLFETATVLSDPRGSDRC